MESPITPTTSSPSATRWLSGVMRGPAGATGSGRATVATTCGAGGLADALAEPSMRVGLRSQPRPSGVRARPAITPTINAAVSALMLARNPLAPRKPDWFTDSC